MPQKIRLRDLDPSLVALIAGGEIGEGQLNNILSRYRKKSEVIGEQDIDAAYRNAVYDRINDVKTKLEEHLAQILVVAEKDLDPALLQRIENMEEKIENAPESKDYSLDILNLQNNIQELRDIIEALDVGTLSGTLVSVQSDLESMQSSLQQLETTVNGIKGDIQSVNSALGNKRDKDTPIQESDLDAATVEKLNQITEILSNNQELSDAIESGLALKRDKSDLIGEKDLDPAIVNKLDSIANANDSVENLSADIDRQLANKRDKDTLILAADLDKSINDQLASIADISGTLTTLSLDVKSSLEKKRDKSVLIKGTDLEQNLSQEIAKITPLSNQLNEFENATNIALDTKRSKNELIAENDLASELANKIGRGTSAYDSVLDLQSRMNMFPQVTPGDLMTTSSSSGGVIGKKLFIEMLTVAEESEATALKNDTTVDKVYVRSTNKVFTRAKQGSSATSSGPADLIAQSDFFSSNVSYWNAFIVDLPTKVIVAYVMSGGKVLRFNVREQRRSLTLNAGASASFTCGNAISVPVRVLAKESGGKYTPADGAISVLYNTDSYTLRNETDENLNIIVIEG